MEVFKKIVKVSKQILSVLKKIFSVNWTKTIYFNFRMLPWKKAKKLPVFFYGKVNFQSLKGQLQITGKLQSGMIGFGAHYEAFQKSKGNAELRIDGTLHFVGSAQFGKDYFVYISETGKCKIGHMSSLGNSGKIICVDSVTLGDYCRIGFESQIIDTNSHAMINSITGEIFPFFGEISLGNYNFIGNRVSIMPQAKTPDYCTVASNSLCNKNYSLLGKNVLIGGLPAKLLQNNITRDWTNEEALFKNLLKF